MPNTDDSDCFPWTDSWTWSPDAAPDPDDVDGDDGLFLLPVFDVDLDHLVLAARLDDGRSASWSAADGWSGDADVVRAAQAVAALWSTEPEIVRNARGLFGASVTGWASEATWIAARL